MRSISHPPRRALCASIYKVALALALALPAAAHADAIHWRSHINIRVNGQDGSLGAADPAELVTSKISREIDYISMNIESAFFRNMAGFTKRHQVVVGVEVEGLLNKNATLKTVGDVQRCFGSDCFVTFDEIPILQPSLYPGRNVSFTLTMRAAGKDEANGIKGRIQGVSGLLKKLDPRADTALQTAAGIFEQIIEGSSGTPITWKYRFSRYPADAVIGEDPSALFTAGRHVILALPPPDAPEEVRKLKPVQLLAELKWMGRRLVWKKTGEEYRSTPYVILSVTRYKRYPNADTELQKLKGKLVAAVEQANIEAAERHLRALPAAISDDKVITNAEKQLERTWVDDYTARLDAERAKARNDDTAERAALQKQLTALLDIKEQFGNILETAEKQDIAFRQKRLRRRIEALDEKLGDGGSKALRKRLEEDLGEEQRVSMVLTNEKARMRRAFGAKVETDPDGFIGAESKVEPVAGEAPEVLRARALEAARLSAVSRVVGKNMAGGKRFFGTALAGLQSTQVKENLPDLMSDALIVDEKIVKEGPVAGGGYEVQLKTKVVRRGARTDPGYRVKLSLSKQNLVEGDDVVVTATPTRDSHLYVFSIGADGDVTVLMPNKFAGVPFVKAGETFTFPTAEVLAKRIKIKAMLPKGAKESAESVKVIALRQPLQLVELNTAQSPFHGVEGKSPLLITGILQKLSALDPDAWCDDTLTYTIRAR